MLPFTALPDGHIHTVQDRTHNIFGWCKMNGTNVLVVRHVLLLALIQRVRAGMVLWLLGARAGVVLWLLGARAGGSRCLVSLSFKSSSVTLKDYHGNYSDSL